MFEPEVDQNVRIADCRIMNHLDNKDYILLRRALTYKMSEVFSITCGVPNMIAEVDMKSRSVISKSEVTNVCHVKSVFFCDPKGVYFYRDLLVGHNDREKAKHANTEEMHCSNRVLHCHIYEKKK